MVRLLLKKLAERAPVFVDNKYYDIPSTVLSALTSTFESGASFATVHASNGPETLKKIYELEKSFNLQRPFQILSVTVLTSYSENNLPSQWAKYPIAKHVELLAQDTIISGLSGVVCSAEEVSILRKNHPYSFLVTPGIRLPTDDKGDQSRVVGPREAMQLGASALVVGRPIVAADNPKSAAQKFASEVRTSI